MKIVFITDFASIPRPEQACISLDLMARDCILRILTYLQQCQTPSSLPLEVGFKFIDCRAWKFIPADIANERRQFYTYDPTSTASIDDEYRRILKATKKERRNNPSYRTAPATKTQTAQSSADGAQTTTTDSHSGSRPHPVPTSCGEPSTPTIMSHQLRDQGGLARVIMAIYQACRQWKWCQTLDMFGLHAADDNSDALEAQMMFVFSSLSSSSEHLDKLKPCLKYTAAKSIAIHFVHVPCVATFSPHTLPYADDQAQYASQISELDACLKQHSFSTLGVLPLSLLWMASSLRLQREFAAVFKSHAVKRHHAQALRQIAPTFWHRLVTLHTKTRLYRETRRWRGPLCMSSRVLVSNCALFSVECVRWQKCATNQLQNTLREIETHCQRICIDGVMDKSQFATLSHMPFISLVLRRDDEGTGVLLRDLLLCCAHSKHEQRFLSVCFDGCASLSNVRGVFYSTFPSSLITLRIYFTVHWNVHMHMTLPSIHPHTTTTTTTISDVFESVCDGKTPILAARTSEGACQRQQARNTQTVRRRIKNKLQQRLQTLYAAKLKHQQAQSQTQTTHAEQEDAQGAGASKPGDSDAIEIDTQSLQLRLNEEDDNEDGHKKTAQQHFDELCATFEQLCDTLARKTPTKLQGVHALIEISLRQLYELSTTRLFSLKPGRKQVKTFLRRRMFVEVKEWSKTHKQQRSLPQQIFDVQMQILLRCECALMHYSKDAVCDPMRGAHALYAYLEKLELRQERAAFDAFMAHLMDRYARHLPNTFVSFFTEKELDIPVTLQYSLARLQPVTDIGYSTSTVVTTTTATSCPSPLQPEQKHVAAASIAGSVEPAELRSLKENHNVESGSHLQRHSRKRTFSEMQESGANPAAAGGGGGGGRSGQVKAPQSVARDIPQKKLVSATSRAHRTLTRSQRGCGALGSGKRPLRLVLDNKTDSSKSSRPRKRRKQEHANAAAHTDLNSSTMMTGQSNPLSAPAAATASSATLAATSSMMQSVFASNTNVALSNPITNSAIKKRCGQWADTNRILSLKRKSQRHRKRMCSRKTPPLLKRTSTVPNLMHAASGFDTDNVVPLSRTQSLDVIAAASASSSSSPRESPRGHSLPVDAHLLDTVSPLQPEHRTRSVAVNHQHGHDEDDHDGQAFRRSQSFQQICDGHQRIDEAMNDAQEWMVSHNTAAAQRPNAPYIAPFLQSIPPTPTFTLRPARPAHDNGQFNFGRGFNHQGDDVFSSAHKKLHIPETPDSFQAGIGIGASPMKHERNDGKAQAQTAAIDAKKRLSFGM